ncbi:hypothetical protein FRX31_023885 [Thalictrum thalictroides]|uniref:Uncharacterized protein n=1 Tax=Thalictrum thalictroides TaxID=46969 RepID=A0A7J6VP66_THATH|nr:hypothetical protein FRX31_023885 [Thalictrum thalictroides]
MRPEHILDILWQSDISETLHGFGYGNEDNSLWKEVVVFIKCGLEGLLLDRYRHHYGFFIRGSKKAAEQMTLNRKAKAKGEKNVVKKVEKMKKSDEENNKENAKVVNKGKTNQNGKNNKEKNTEPTEVDVGMDGEAVKKDAGKGGEEEMKDVGIGGEEENMDVGKCEEVENKDAGKVEEEVVYDGP